MASNDYTIFHLSNGLRCVHSPARGRAAYIGICVGAGSRDESSLHHGLAHFVEHTIFKGTLHRSSWHINNRMESIGGELNAYTTKEVTVVYTNSPLGNSDRALELLADLVGYSNFPTSEIDKEREVVIEEIHSYLDSPNENVFDLFDDLAYSGSSMGHAILGTPDSVRQLTSADCRGFIDDFYVPSRMTLFIVDDSSPAKAQRLAEKRFGCLHFRGVENQRETPVVNAAFDKVLDEDGHQAHTVMGTRVCDCHSEKRFPLFLLNNLLGGPAMNSLLNLELRERRGLVYTVDSSLSLMSDCGLIQIYFGCDRDQTARCSTIIRRQLEKLAANTLSPKVFDTARRQYLGQLLVGSDQLDSMAMSLGRSLLLYDEVHDAAWTAERIAAVSAEEVRAAAEEIMNQGLSSMTIK